ncbi:hypothetical protein OESDEN_03863 [Oesophagostomum dentatum]|uniref:L-Fucosyltransferase n=1 Tax=Oesophagostomum dentatum TaxID=61180 RepID=A0A0B1TLC4_OESDE|nr:hypothetical protein OESDEN_03863 [Oesophagostomum dentatum]
MEYGHNPKYFEDYLPEVRQILQFSTNIQHTGEDVLHKWNITDYNFVCVHITRTNFTNGSIFADMMSAAKAAKDIAAENHISQFLIFGDDKEIKRDVAVLLRESNTSKENTAIASNNDEAVDLYVSSRICNSFLMATVTSTFGWWLAFFAPNQHHVFYLPDKRPVNDKVPSKELFLKTWQEYRG